MASIENLAQASLSTPKRGDVVRLRQADLQYINGKIGIVTTKPNADNEVSVMWSGGKVSREPTSVFKLDLREKDNSINHWTM